MFRVALFISVLSAMVFATGSGVSYSRAAAQEATPDASCTMTSEDENTTLVRGYYDAIFSGNVNALDEFLAPEVVRHGGGGIPDALGPEDIKRNFTLYFAAFPDLQSEIQQIVADDDLVAVRSLERGTQTGDLRGVPASGKEASWGIFVIYRIECGKLAEYWSEIDELGRLQQLGVIPPMIPAIAATPTGEEAVAASPSTCPTTSTDENEALVQRWYDEVYSQRNFDNFDEIIAADHVRHGLHRDTTGAESRQDAVQVQQTAFPDLDLQVNLLLAEDDLVVSRWTATGTHDGPWQGIAPTGSEVTWTGNTLFRITCGRIAEEWAEVDTLPVFEAIGAITMPAALPASEATPAGS